MYSNNNDSYNNSNDNSGWQVKYKKKRAKNTGNDITYNNESAQFTSYKQSNNNKKTNANSVTNTNTYTNTYANTHTNTHANTHTNTHADTYDRYSDNDEKKHVSFRLPGGYVKNKYKDRKYEKICEKILKDPVLPLSLQSEIDIIVEKTIEEEKYWDFVYENWNNLDNEDPDNETDNSGDEFDDY